MRECPEIALVQGRAGVSSFLSRCSTLLTHDTTHKATSYARHQDTQGVLNAEANVVHFLDGRCLIHCMHIEVCHAMCMPIDNPRQPRVSPAKDDFVKFCRPL